MFWTLLITAATGARTMTGIAVICWAAWLGWLPVEGTWAFPTAKLPSVLIFTLLALGEYVVDTLPGTPSRRNLALVGPRLFFAMLCGTIVATALHEPKAGGIVLGLVGVTVGIYGGYALRMWLARVFGRDLPAALLESALSLGMSLFAVHRIHLEVLRYADRVNDALLR